MPALAAEVGVGSNGGLGWASRMRGTAAAFGDGGLCSRRGALRWQCLGPAPAGVCAETLASTDRGPSPLRECSTSDAAPPDLDPRPATMAAVRRARSYCRCLVRFSDRELC